MGRIGLLDRSVSGGLCLVSMSTAIAFLLSIGVVAHESATGAIGTAQIPAARAMPKFDRLDQGSCWYAIFFCSRGPDEALRWTERHAQGRVIDTLSLEVPRLKKGYYCAVDGPLPRSVAVERAQTSKRSGRAPAAYAKEGC
jgi:hypothetical protein